jgi:hypothetical protein
LSTVDHRLSSVVERARHGLNKADLDWSLGVCNGGFRDCGRHKAETGGLQQFATIHDLVPPRGKEFRQRISKAGTSRRCTAGASRMFRVRDAMLDNTISGPERMPGELK